MIQILNVFYNAFASERDQKCTCPRLHTDYYFFILNVQLNIPDLKKSFNQNTTVSSKLSRNHQSI